MAKNRYGILQKILKALGLSDDAIQEVLAKISELLSGKQEQGGAEEKVVKEPPPYHLRDDFLSQAEHNFYHMLVKAAGEWAVVCPKVGLGDLFYASTGDHFQNRIWRNRIDRKHVDFLLCQPGTMRPLLGVELDDRSHKRRDRQQRDRFVDQVFKAAGLRLIHVPVQHTYDVNRLVAFVKDRVEATAVTAVDVVEPVKSAAGPVCPNCGGDMALRTAKSGPNRGNQFWGCTNYPKCKGIVAVERAAKGA